MIRAEKRLMHDRALAVATFDPATMRWTVALEGKAADANRAVFVQGYEQILNAKVQAQAAKPVEQIAAESLEGSGFEIAEEKPCE